MDKKEKWSNFIDTLYLDAIKNFESSKIFEYQNERKTHMEEVIDSNIPPCDKPIFEEILSEMQKDYEYKINLFYRQGFLDCIHLLKSINIFV